MRAPEPGIHLVHKPPGTTSFSLVRAFQADARAAGARGRKICHGGSLDPFAEGLLPILVGSATRLFELLHPIPKVYLADVAWGAETDNGDPHGRVVSRGDASALAPAALDEALRQFVGWTEQVPPATSNKRIAGERAYARAHRGEEFVLPPARVYLHEARWLAHDLPRASRLRIVVRGGFYVRSLVRDLGRALGCGAHVSRLQRTAIGPWSDPTAGTRVHVAGPALLPWCASRVLSDAEVGELRAGRPIERGDRLPPEWPLPEGFPDPEAPLRGLHLGRLVALLEERDGWLVGAIDLRAL